VSSDFLVSYVQRLEGGQKNDRKMTGECDKFLFGFEVVAITVSEIAA